MDRTAETQVDYALDQSPEVQKAREEAKAEAEERAAQAGEE